MTRLAQAKAYAMRSVQSGLSNNTYVIIDSNRLKSVLLLKGNHVEGNAT
jgi:hypothetical protein